MKLFLNIQNRRVTNIKRSLVLILYLLFEIACFIVVFVVQAQQEKSENLPWGANFAISFLQDLILAPIISITIKVLLIKFSQNRRTAKLKRIRKFINFVFPTFKSIYVKKKFLLTNPLFFRIRFLQQRPQFHLKLYLQL